MRTVLLAVLVTLFTFAVSDPCTISTTAGDINLNGLINSQGYYKQQSAGNTYYLNICGTAQNFDVYSSSCSKTPGSKAYQIISEGTCFPMSGTGTSDITLALVDSSNPKGGVVLTYADYKYEDYTRTTEFTISCDPTADTPVLTFDDEAYVPQHSTYKFKVTSKYGCPGTAPVPAPSGGGGKPLGELGVGGLIVVILLALFILYFIVGAIVCKFALKKEGKEIIPNVGLWISLLTAIKDGPLLFVDLIKGKKAYETV